jgi:hypothetical protein
MTIHLIVTCTSKRVSSCCFVNLHCYSAPNIRNLVDPYPHAPPCALNLKNQEEMKKNEAFLPSEKEESRTLVRALTSLQMHTISQAISHSTTGESKSV